MTVENFQIVNAVVSRDVNNSLMVISGGNAASSGANIEIHGGTHATLSDDILVDADYVTFRRQSGASSTLYIDATGRLIGINRSPLTPFHVEDSFAQDV